MIETTACAALFITFPIHKIPKFNFLKHGQYVARVAFPFPTCVGESPTPTSANTQMDTGTGLEGNILVSGARLRLCRARIRSVLSFISAWKHIVSPSYIFEIFCLSFLFLRARLFPHSPSCFCICMLQKVCVIRSLSEF